MELLDVYNDEGVKIDKVVQRGDVGSLLPGEHIAVAIIYIENDEGKFLMQKTSREKGGLYSSTGGHVDHGEKPIDTIKREVEEELGINIDDDTIIDLGYLLFDLPIRFVFYLKKNIDLSEVKIQDEEVDSVSYMSVDDIKKKLSDGLMHEAHYKVLERILEYKDSL